MSHALPLPDEFEPNVGQEGIQLSRAMQGYDALTEDQKRTIAEWVYHTTRASFANTGVPEGWLVEAFPDEKWTDAEQKTYGEAEEKLLTFVPSTLRRELLDHIYREVEKDLTACGFPVDMQQGPSGTFIESELVAFAQGREITPAFLEEFAAEQCKDFEAKRDAKLAELIAAGTIQNRLTKRSILVYDTLQEVLGYQELPIDPEEARLTQMYARLTDAQKRLIAEWIRKGTYDQLKSCGVPESHIVGLDVVLTHTEEDEIALFDFLAEEMDDLDNEIKEYQASLVAQILAAMGVPAGHTHGMIIVSSTMDAGIFRDIYRGSWPPFTVPATYQELIGLRRPANYEALLAYKEA
ncbi:Hypothetical protein POVN_LOCUS672 [uncultured virus]|nr:Hypothetical protein POVN_LOCUS672 [uncultured virus]